MIKFLLNLGMFLLMIAIGVVAFINMKGKTKPVVHQDKGMVAKAVDVIVIKKSPFSATVVAYGNIEPTVIFQGKAEVGGKVTYVHPALKRGGSIEAGTVVIRIDPIDYKLSLDKTRSDLRASQSQLSQLKQEKQSTQLAIALANENLRLGLKELKRIQNIFSKGLIAASKLDIEEQKVIQLRQKLSDLRGKLKTYSSRIENAKAVINRSKQQVIGGKTTLARTEIKIPFDARISKANINKGEIITTGTLLFEAINIDAVEINAELPIKTMQILLSTLEGKSLEINAKNNAKILKNMQLKARVKLIGANKKAVWQGRVVRFSESVNPTRHTMAVTVVVDYPYKNIIVGSKPPLLKGMYVAVELYAPAYHAIVIPRKALHSERVFIVNQQNKLEIRQVDIQSKQGNIAVIRSGLKVGEKVVTTDLIPVIEGMPLTPLLAKQSQQEAK